MRDLDVTLGVGSVALDDLISVITGFFGTSRTEATSVVFPMSGPPALTIEVDRARSAHVIAGPALTAEQRDSLVGRVTERLLNDVGRYQIRQQVLFASRPVSGSYRHPSGEFQILPAPPNAPRPRTIVGDHPFLIEYRDRFSSDALIRGARARRGATEWAWVLQLLLREGVRDLGSRSTRHRWVLWPEEFAEERPIEAQIHYAQEAYWFSGQQPFPEMLSVPASPDLVRLPAKRYWTSGGDDFELPEYVDDVIGRYLSLGDAERVTFLRAAHWFYSAGEIWPIHVGASLVALVSAVEVLAGYAAEPAHPCASCGRDHHPGATRRFREFVERFSTGIDRRTIDRFYALRSDLVHGTSGMVQDEVYGPGSTPSYWAEWQNVEQLYRLVRLVGTNWLRQLETVYSR